MILYFAKPRALVPLRNYLFLNLLNRITLIGWSVTHLLRKETVGLKRLSKIKVDGSLYKLRRSDCYWSSRKTFCSKSID